MSFRRSIILLSAISIWACIYPAFAHAEPTNELVELVVGLFREKDKDLRSVGFEQVRTDAKGEAATLKFAAQLPKLPPESQAGLLNALADRGDPAALAAIAELLATTDDVTVRVAAIKAVGTLGNAENLTLLLKSAESTAEAERAAVQAGLVRLAGEKTNVLLAAETTQGSPERRALLIEVLATRRAYDQVPRLLPGAVDEDPAVRYASMAALAQLAGPEHLPTMLLGVLKATAGLERESAEKAVVSVCNRTENADERVSPLLAAIRKLGVEEQISLLSLVGKVGGAAALTALEADLKSRAAARRAAALEALCHWPDATIADKLKAMAGAATDDVERDRTFRAFVRVGALRDNRSDQQRFERLQQAMSLAKSLEEQKIAIRAFRQAYLVESMRYVLPFLDQPELTQVACETIVELAHHKDVREPYKEEFDKALDRVLQLSTDEVIKLRAQLYQSGQTWLRPQKLPQQFDPTAARALQATTKAKAKLPAKTATDSTKLYLAVGAGALLLIVAWVVLGPRKSAPQ